MASKQSTAVTPSNPEYTRQITLETTPAKKVLHREFRRTAASVFRTSVILRTAASASEAEQIDEAIQEILQTVRQELRREIERLESLREEHGVDFLPDYTNPSHESVRIQSPYMARYLALILDLDRLAKIADALWLADVLDNHQRSQAYYQWERRTARAGRKIVDLERRANAAQRRAGQMDAKASAQSSSDSSTATAGQETEAANNGDLGGKGADEDSASTASLDADAASA